MNFFNTWEEAMRDANSRASRSGIRYRVTRGRYWWASGPVVA